METNNNKEMQLQCQQLGPTLLFDKLMELQDLWSCYVADIAEDYAKTNDNVNDFLDSLNASGQYPFGLDIRKFFKRSDNTFVNLKCKIGRYAEDLIFVYVKSSNDELYMALKMEHILHQDKPALVQQLWIEYLQTFLKQTEEEIAAIKNEYDSKLLTINTLDVELEKLNRQ